jgi:hypothetical protein
MYRWKLSGFVRNSELFFRQGDFPNILLCDFSQLHQLQLHDFSLCIPRRIAHAILGMTIFSLLQR